MAVCVRFIARAKWPDEDELNVIDVDYIKADAITGSLKTDGNTLSTWEVDNEYMISDAVLAFVSKAEKIDTLHTIWIDNVSISSSGLNTRKSDGNTIVNDMRSNHCDVYDLKLFSLRIFASLVLDSLRREQYKLFPKQQVFQILKQGLDDKRLTVDDLNDKLKEAYTTASKRYNV